MDTATIAVLLAITTTIGGTIWKVYTVLDDKIKACELEKGKSDLEKRDLAIRVAMLETESRDTGAAFFVRDTKGIIISVSFCFFERYGAPYNLAREDFIGRNLPDVYAPELVETLNKLHRAAIIHGEAGTSGVVMFDGQQSVTVIKRRIRLPDERVGFKTLFVQSN